MDSNERICPGVEEEEEKEEEEEDVGMLWRCHRLLLFLHSGLYW